jgi:8-hydroxy-5-deazaflavin:NADPH oxidoreductase
MRFAVLGSGQVGRSLGAGLARHGHTVVMGTRDPGAERVVAWAAQAGERASAATHADAAAGCEVAVLATVWTGTENALQLAGASNLAGKIVIDVTNPLGFGPSGPTLVLGHTDSAGEQVQRWLPESRVVKTWNIVNHAHMIDPDIPGGPGDMFYCGNDAEAKVFVADLLDQCGWPSIDAGGIDGARLLEPLTILWVRYAMSHSTSNHAFKLLHP